MSDSYFLKRDEEYKIKHGHLIIGDHSIKFVIERYIDDIEKYIKELEKTQGIALLTEAGFDFGNNRIKSLNLKLIFEK